jgi:hypothetical protein
MQMQLFLDIVRQSLATLWAHKLRSFLTMFGIAWGVGSLLLLVGLGEGFRSGQEKNLRNLVPTLFSLFQDEFLRSRAVNDRAARGISPTAIIWQCGMMPSTFAISRRY